MKNKFTGERLETHILNDNAIKHLHRYCFASNLVHEKVVLDIASGEGYGSNLLSENATFVYGVDIDKNTVERAKSKYKKDNIQFLIGNTSNIPLKDNSIDVVVSYETLEHHDEHERMMQEIKRVLRKKGLLIISTPDKHFYSDERKFDNEFHVKELYKSEFKGLMTKYFSNLQILTQSYLNGSSIVLDEKDRKKIEFYTGDYTYFLATASAPQFMIAIASDEIFEKQNNSLFEGSKILNNSAYLKKIENIYNSRSYRLGHFMLWPLKFLKRIFKS